MDKKILYVSDLDGTLFNSDKKISDYTADVLNRCIEKGMKFAVATARMPYGCDYRLKAIHMDTPGILTNGVFLYDFKDEKVISAEEIAPDSAKKAVKAFQETGLSCFVYTYDENGISIWYGDKDLEKQTQYYSEQALKKCKNVCLMDKMEEVFTQGRIVYITYTGEKEQLEPVCRKLDKIAHLSYSFYLNIYNGWYCLEIFSDKASKKNALKKLVERMESEELVVFGDNLNDLSMIEIADRSYAPKNALPEVKQVVTKVLEDCNHDGVAKFLKEEWEVQKDERDVRRYKNL